MSGSSRQLACDKAPGGPDLNDHQAVEARQAALKRWRLDPAANGQAQLRREQRLLPPPARATAPLSDGHAKAMALGCGALETVRLLDEDLDLRAGLEGSELDAARGQAHAVMFGAYPPAWNPAAIIARAQLGWLGLLVLDGLLVRRVQVGRRRSCELFGPGDLLRPWDVDDVHDPLAVTVDWLVRKPTRLAVLDSDFLLRTARWPTIHSQIVARAVGRARDLALIQAVDHFPTAHARLLIVFWVLAARWGKVTPDGVLITLPITHELLSMLIGTRRPTVTLALQRLARLGLLVRKDREQWLLSSTAIESLNQLDNLQLVDDEVVLSA
ncbi:MAG TPA: helix-turn-helix domain-containing protein [Solirubrobacteraceae bacterium]|nr:helix-turn-helix domain-containing protein [Solirubrobacteraceae bacterium]